MKLIDLLNELAISELSNLAVAANGVIRDDAIPQIISAANEGLLRLYSKFILSERSVVLQTYKHITNYHLLSRFAKSKAGTSNEPYLYILDLSDEPFADDVIRISEVYLNHSVKLPMNDVLETAGVYTPQYNIVQYPNPKDNEFLTVIYQAKPKVIKEEDIDFDLLDVPWFLLDALKSYIAYKVFSNMNTNDATAKASEHFARFEKTCTESYVNGQVVTIEPTACTKFKSGGWI